MSYDLMVFDAEAAPRNREDFMHWYREITKWQEKRNYNSLDGVSDKLSLFFHEIRKEFPPMNGEYASDDFDDPKVTDYSIASNAIYICFAWSVAEEAYVATKSIASKAEVGFFDVSADNGDIIFPNITADTANKKIPFWQRLFRK